MSWKQPDPERDSLKHTDPERDELKKPNPETESLTKTDPERDGLKQPNPERDSLKKTDPERDGLKKPNPERERWNGLDPERERLKQPSPERDRFNKMTDPEREQLQLNLFPDPKIQTEISQKKHIASGVMIPETYITETLSHHFVDSKKGYHIWKFFQKQDSYKIHVVGNQGKDFQKYKNIQKSYKKLWKVIKS